MFALAVFTVVLGVVSGLAGNTAYDHYKQSRKRVRIVKHIDWLVSDGQIHQILFRCCPNLSDLYRQAHFIETAMQIANGALREWDGGMLSQGQCSLLMPDPVTCPFCSMQHISWFAASGGIWRDMYDGRRASLVLWALSEVKLCSYASMSGQCMLAKHYIPGCLQGPLSPSWQDACFLIRTQFYAGWRTLRHTTHGTHVEVAPTKHFQRPPENNQKWSSQGCCTPDANHHLHAVGGPAKINLLNDATTDFHAAMLDTSLRSVMRSKMRSEWLHYMTL